ncbi:MAG TPA: adenylate/guanylate cyclase domain-containing protein [Stellaceae bacterium]|nr:adenylate/guanylate cyclase domain-containing protein [Stellaceae bacterium]
MPEQRVVRRLAAILAADVVGYSRLIGRDAEGTVARLKAHRRELIDPKIAEYNGRIVNTSGDGILLEFPSIIEAVSCAICVQRGMAERNAAIAEEERIVFRIGINFGDIIVEDDDIHGDGINIAARLEPLSEPGGICISEDTFRQVRSKFDADFEDIGEQNLKNIARPIRAYRFRPRSPPAAAAPPGKPSIAVLPFQNLSGDPEQEYFADGMVEEIITVLSRIRWLSVIARNSSFVHKGQAVDVKRVGRELGVRYVLEGSVRKAAGRVRITAQLIEAETGAHLWADRFDGSLKGGFALQDQVATAVVGALELALRAAEEDRHREEEKHYRRQETAAPATELGTIDEAVLATVQRCLARHVGPLAEMLVASAAREARSVAQLCELLAERIERPEERRDFLRAVRREGGVPAAAPAPAAGSVPAPSVLPPATVELALTELARVIGPLAHVLAARELPLCASAAELWARLAEHIEEPAERAAFLRRQPGAAARPRGAAPRRLRRKSPPDSR